MNQISLSCLWPVGAFPLFVGLSAQVRVMRVFTIDVLLSPLIVSAIARDQVPDLKRVIATGVLVTTHPSKSTSCIDSFGVYYFELREGASCALAPTSPGTPLHQGTSTSCPQPGCQVLRPYHCTLPPYPLGQGRQLSAPPGWQFHPHVVHHWGLKYLAPFWGTARPLFRAW